jgi:hypothetical protein
MITGRSTSGNDTAPTCSPVSAGHKGLHEAGQISGLGLIWVAASRVEGRAGLLAAHPVCLSDHAGAMRFAEPQTTWFRWPTATAAATSAA